MTDFTTWWASIGLTVVLVSCAVDYREGVTKHETIFDPRWWVIQFATVLLGPLAVPLVWLGVVCLPIDDEGDNG